MYRSILSVLLVASILICAVPARSYTLQFTDASGSVQIKWPTNTITVALSTSLTAPPPNIKAGSDVIGAARRALAQWSVAANIQFVETSSSLQSISPTGGGGDGVSLITVANTPENVAAFGGSDRQGRTRVFFNPSTGALSEADIVINPNQQFSTDGTAGTFDLESTLVHEVGHLLGLGHSAVVGATMQPSQGRNGLYSLPALTPRTLSDDDRAGARQLYGTQSGTGGIGGTIRNAAGPLFGAHVWAENVATGRVVAGNVTLADGRYQILDLPPGTYRVIVEPLNEPVSGAGLGAGSAAYAALATSAPAPFLTSETELNVAAGAVTNYSPTLASSTALLNPRLLGLNSELSTIAVPLTRGNTYTLFVGGDGLDQVPGSGISVPSPFFSINQASLQRYQFGATPVISFDVTVSPNAPPGDYSIRLLTNASEVAYIAGGLAVEVATGPQPSNPIDDPQVFVRQHYLDFLNREPDTGGLDYWTSQITQCGSDAACVNRKRVDVSAAFFIELEFQETGYFVYLFYKASYNRQPSFAEFSTDRASVVGGTDLETSKRAFADGWVQRSEFLQAYPLSQTPEQFVNKLFDTAGLFPYTVERQRLADEMRGGKTRAQVLREVIEIAELKTREYNPAFVLMQYFGYLRRDADPGGYQFWLDVLNNREPGNFRGMVCAFITSTEYQLRFGSLATRSNQDCGSIGP